MTKHLRLIMLSLLAMICMGGYSAVGDTYKLVTSVDELHDGDLIVIVNSDNQKAMGMQNKNNRASVAISFTDDTRESFNLVAKVAVLTLKKADDKWKFHSTHGYLYAPGTSKKNYLKSSTDEGTIAGSLATITITNKNATIQFDSKNSNIIRYNSAIDPQIFSCYPPDNKQKDVQIYKKQGSGLTSTSTTFGTNYDGKTFDFVNGVLEGWKAPTATHTPADVAGTTAYKSDNEAVATVDAKGQLTFKGYGTAKITATFTPKETETYAESTASYTITNIKSKYYATVADLRKDLNNGTLTANDEVAVKLTDAKVLYVNQWTSNKVDHTQYFVREGNAAISFYDTDIKMSKSAVVNGTFMGKIGSLTGLLVLTKNNNTNPAGLQVKTSTKPAEPIEISTDDIANYVCDLVTVKGATVIGGTDCALFNGNNLMPLYYNKFFPRTTSLEAPYDNANVDLTSAIVLTYVNDKNDKKKLVYELAPTDKYTLVYNLSEESVNTIAAKTDIAVSLKRTFYKDGEWNTLCLPFAVADAKTAFDNAELREVDTEKSNGNTIVFKEATAIEAGKPYLIKWVNSSAAAVNVEKKFEGVTLVAAATPVEVNNGGISFNGFYKMTEASELGASVAAIGAGNKLFKVIEGKMKGFRAAFVLSSGAEATKYNVVIDGTATGIEDLVIDGVKANGRVYNLNGQYVGNSLNGLQPGLYIQNGKKIVVK